MRADTVVIVRESLNGPSQMLLAEDDRMIQALSSDRSNHALSVRILPGRSRCRQHFAQPNRFNLPTEKLTEFSVSITHEKLRRIVNAHGLKHLSRRPLCCRRLRHVRMEDLPTIVTEQDQNKQYPKGRGRYREEISGDDIFRVIFEEGSPTLRRRFSASDHVLGHDRLGDIDAELQ